MIELPLFPLNTVLFPHLLMPLSVGRPASVAAVEAALRDSGQAWRDEIGSWIAELLHVEELVPEALAPGGYLMVGHSER